MNNSVETSPSQQQPLPVWARRHHIATTDLIIRIAVSIVLGGLIGLERELRDQPAGLRTHLLVCLGSTVFTLASIHGFDALFVSSAVPHTSDPARVAAQIVVGVGFLGAGAIIRQGVTVHGLTTAASLWTMAALGMVVGLGWYALAAIAAVAVAVSLVVLRAVEVRLINPRARDHAGLEVTLPSDATDAPAALIALLEGFHIDIEEMESKSTGDGSRMVSLSLVLPRRFGKTRLFEEASRVIGVRDVAVR